MRHFKYGRKPAVKTPRVLRSMQFMSAALDQFGPAPAACNDYLSAVKVPWGMMLNDQIGDCTCADSGHTLMLRTANASSIIIPSDADIEKLYEQFGYDPSNSEATDNGVTEVAMCDFLVSTGFLGHKASAVGSVDYTNLDHIKWTVQLFGHCRIGLNLPAYAEDQFMDGKPWDVSSFGDHTVMGHDVPVVDFKGNTLYVITWGKVQPITIAAYQAWCEEAHSEVWPDFVRSQGTAPSGFDLADLIAKQKEVDA